MKVTNLSRELDNTMMLISEFWRSQALNQGLRVDFANSIIITVL